MRRGGREMAWKDLIELMRGLDLRDMSDDANRWADDESAAPAAMPTNLGEWKASLVVAFEAGRRWELDRPTTGGR